MSFPTFDVNNNRTDVIEPGELHIQDGDIQVHMSNNNSYAAVELGGSSGAYVDFKAPYIDNYDFRLIREDNNFSLYGRESDSSAPHLFLTCSNTHKAIGIGTNASADAVLDVSGNIFMGYHKGIANTTGFDRRFTIAAGSEESRAELYFGTAHLNTTPLKTAIIAQGMDSYSRSKLMFCLNNDDDNNASYTASTSDARMTILPSGNVGIGSTNPSEALDVSGSIRCFSSGGNSITFKGDADYTNLIGERHVYIKANGNDQSGVAHNDGQIIFVPGTGAGEKVRINKDGNVGIGTDNPGFLLDVYDTAQTIVNVGVGTGATNSNGSLQLIKGDNARIRTTGTDNLIFDTNSSERMRIKDTGNVGIGSASPGYKLDVAGDIRASSNIYVGANPVVTTGDTGTVSNTMLAGSISNNKLANFTISGKALGSNLATLSQGNGISMSSYNGSAARTIALQNSFNVTGTIQAGKIGIGTTNPGMNLHLYKSGGGGQLRISDNNTKMYLGTTSNSDGYLWVDSNYDFKLGTNSKERIRVKKTGETVFRTSNSATGTTDHPCLVLTNGGGNSNTTAPQIKFCYNNNDDEQYPSYIVTRADSAYENKNGMDFYICNGTQTSTQADSGTALAMTLTGEGSVGIGTTNPSAPLHVKEGDTNYGLTAGYYFAYNFSHVTQPGVLKYDSSGYAPSNSILAAGGITSEEGFYADSDSRIKTNISDINDESALTKLREIEPKTYQYIDTIKRNNVTVYGFIAQQIKEVLPKAVTFQNRTIPSIFELCNATSSSNNEYYDTITFTNFNTANLDASSNNLVIVDANNEKHAVNILSVLDSSSVQVDTDVSEWMGAIGVSNETVIANEVQKYEKVILDASNNVVVENYDIAPIASMDACGNVVGNKADLTGDNTIDSSNNYVDSSGNFIAGPVNSDGHYIDASGNYFDTNGNFMDASNNLVGTYRTEWKKVTINGTKIFVYGQNVGDFHVLQKEYIFTVATAALQEVDRQLQAEKAKTATLESQVADLLARVTALESA